MLWLLLNELSYPPVRNCKCLQRVQLLAESTSFNNLCITEITSCSSCFPELKCLTSLRPHWVPCCQPLLHVGLSFPISPGYHRRASIHWPGTPVLLPLPQHIFHQHFRDGWAQNVRFKGTTTHQVVTWGKRHRQDIVLA